MQLSAEQIPHNEWPHFFDEFTNRNKGRSIKIERAMQDRREEVEREMPLFGIDYDPHHGEMISISLGVDRLKYEHPIMGPKEVKVEKDSEGRAKVMRVTDKDDEEFIVTFQS
jgi:hypothetical protein